MKNIKILISFLVVFPFVEISAEDSIWNSVRQDSLETLAIQKAATENDTEEQIPQIVPPSPTVQWLCRYGETPVGYNTGIPEITIPLYTVKCGSLELPITLSYHAGGIKVDDIASWVGLGWSLNAGGVISATIVGHYDSFINRADTLPSYSDVVNERFTGLSGTELLRAYNTACKDYQPDIFTYNFLGHSGQMLYDGNDQQWYNFTGDKSVIFKRTDSRGPFTATDNKGNKYAFNDQETNGQLGDGITSSSVAYHMSEYVSCDAVDSIKFSYIFSSEYDNVKVMDPLAYGASEKKKWEQLGNVSWTNKIGSKSYKFPRNNEYYYTTQKLSRIKASNGTTIEFVHDTSRDDIKRYPSQPQNARKLSRIIIYDAYGNRIKSWEFLYDYFIAGTTSSYCPAHNKRLKLIGLREYGSTDTEPREYFFSYYGDSDGEPIMPHRNAYSGKDAWGYCNGMPTQEEATDSMMSYPNFKDVEFCFYRRHGQTEIYNENLTLSYTAGRDVNTNEAFVHAYSLKQITYPSGGYEKFIYEPNHYSVVDRFRSQKELPDTVSCYGGGIRIKQIISCSCESTVTRTFEYSEGNVPRHPHFLKRRFYEERAQEYDVLHRQNIITTYLQLCPNAVNTSYISKSNNVMYPLVREIYDDGYVEYTHTMLEDTTDPDFFNGSEYDMYSGFTHFIGANFGGDYVYKVTNDGPYYTNENSTVQNTDNFSDYSGYNGAFFRRGQLESKRYYDKNGSILKEEAYSYTTKDIHQVAGMDLKREAGLDWFVPHEPIAGYRELFFYYTVYWMTTGTSLLTGKEVTTHFYDNGRHTSNTVHYGYTYTPDNLLRTETMTGSGGETVSVTTLYPSDINAMPYTKMKEDYMLDYPVERTVRRNGNVEHSTLMEYAEFGNSFYLKSGYTYKPSDTGTVFTPYSGTRATYYGVSDFMIDSYEHGWIAKMGTKDGLKRSYIWGYKNEYPIREITDNVYHSDVLQAITGKAHIREFTYAPQVGMTSETAPTNLRFLYGYDTMGRLSSKAFSIVGMKTGITTERYSYNESGNDNYVKTETILDAYDNNHTTSITYYDGLNRPVETVANGLNQAGTYAASHTAYDSRGRESEIWLPVVCGTSPDYVPYSSVGSLASSTYSDACAYSHKSYDILDRPLKETTPGSAWHSGGKGVTYEYLTNTANSVMKYDAPCGKNSLVKDGYYKANTLTSVKTTDEDGHTLEIFSDFEGRKILERRNGNNDTYFVYNVLGQLRYVLTPQYQTDKAKDMGAYEYRYDSNGNVVKKILPGCEYMQYWYDSSDRIIAMQDGRMRAGTSSNHHTFYIYDKFGRLAIQGGCTGLAHPGGNLAVMDISTPQDQTWNLGGYTVRYPYNFNNPKAEIARYYDDYDFVEYCGTLQDLPIDSLKPECLLPFAVESSGKGQLTGQFVVDSEKNYTLTAFFYDIRGNVVASRSISSDRTYTSTRTDYTFLNTVKRTVQTVIRDFGTPNARKTCTDVVNTYDERSGKLLHSDLTVTDDTGSKSRRIESYGYDDLGRVSKLEQGNGVHTTSYGYDLHGWTTAVTGDAFAESLGYATGAHPCYNGSISSMEWMTADDHAARRYDFTYDGLNRMTDAVYDDAAGGRNRYNETVSYNANGSALTIKRNGRNDAGSYTAIDNLTLGYRGNRLLKVTDKGDACTATGATDFNDGANITVEYTYDACGARTSDANKGIASIRYSYWGTPELIQFTNGSQTRYVYDASGVKQKRIHITAVDNIVVPLKTVMELSDDQILTSDTTEYLGNLVFENGRLDKVLFSSGYVSCNDNAANRFTFHYFVKDHLGNNRAVVNESGAIEQTTHYYPFGNSIADIGTNASIQQYKYNGKELDRMHGLDWYDYGARNYDPVILQWDRPDPLAEKYYPVSPYVYCHDNPVSLFDVNGMDDLFDEYGLFIKRTEKGSSIMIKYGDGYKNIVDVDFSNNYEAIENIGRHYISKSDKGKFSLRVSNIDNGIPDAAFSYSHDTDKYDIYLTDGHVNFSLGDYNDFECVTYHESFHRNNDTTGNNAIDDLKAIIQTTRIDAWGKATNGYIESQKVYAARQLENIMNLSDFEDYLQKINRAFQYATFINVNNKIEIYNFLNEIQCTGNSRR